MSAFYKVLKKKPDNRKSGYWACMDFECPDFDYLLFFMYSVDDQILNLFGIRTADFSSAARR